MKKIYLKGKHSDKFVIVDDDDYRSLKGISIYYHSRGYAQIWLGGKIFLLHRYIMGTKKGLDTDHINGNKLDNRRQNLRVCSRGDNIQNQKGWSKYGFKGVCKNRSCWQANIYHNKRRYFLGNFSTAEEAALAYNAKAIEIYGDKSYLNVVG